MAEEEGRQPVLFLRKKNNVLYAYGIVENGLPGTAPRDQKATYSISFKLEDVKDLAKGRKDWIFVNVYDQRNREEEEEDDMGGEW